MLYLLQDFGNLANADDLVLELPNQGIMKDEITLNFAIDDGVEDEFEKCSGVLFNFDCLVVDEKVEVVLPLGLLEAGPVLLF